MIFITIYIYIYTNTNTHIDINFNRNSISRNPVYSRFCENPKLYWDRMVAIAMSNFSEGLALY